MKATAIVPNYNHAKYLPECLDAILSQTRPFDEIIIVDDASTDDSDLLIQTYLKKYPHIRYIKNPKNLGVCTTFNNTLSIATGDFVAMCGADDFISSDYLEKTMNIAEKHPDLGLITSDIHQFIDKAPYQFTKVKGIENCESVQIFTPGIKLYKQLRENNFVFSWGCLYRREYLVKFGYKNELASLSDFYVNSQISLTYPIAYIPEVLANARINTVQGSYGDRIRRSYDKRKKATKLLLDLVYKKEDEAFRRGFKKSQLLGCLGYFLVFTAAHYIRYWPYLPKFLYQVIRRK